LSLSLNLNLTEALCHLTSHRLAKVTLYFECVSFG